MSWVRGFIVAGVVTVASLVGCASLTGLSDLEVDDSDAAAGSGGTGNGGSGGNTGGTGNSGAGGTGNGGTGGGVPNCTDGSKNGNEIGVDCGGGCPAACPNGTQCTTGSDCVSTFCIDGRCCNTGCNGACESCGNATGVCTPVSSGQDPDNECANDDNCNGSGVCLCLDGEPNGSETGVDCGGPVCPACGGNCNDGILNNGETDLDCGGPNCGAKKCANGKNCGGGADCTSTVCFNGKCCGPTNPCTGGKNCGTILDNCGQNIPCPGPPCLLPDTCIGNICTCQDNGQACAGKNCGNVTNNCGAQVSCGTCAGTCTAGICKKNNGTACGVGSECLSNFCIKNVCCGQDCSGQCQECSAASGFASCGAPGFDNSCPGNHYCVSPGQCGCNDGQMLNGETDTDCGGPCDPCGQNLHCGINGNANCQSGNCCSCCGENVCKPAGNCASFSHGSCSSC
jgi:hypothetical protein